MNEPRSLLIVTADDFGLTPGVCRGILQAAERGIVTTTTALAVGPAFADHVGALVSSGVPTGAHLAAVGEDPPILEAAEVPTLVDRRGRFPVSWRQFVVRAATGRVDADDLRREFTAQVQVLRDAGVHPTHLDAHQHLHLWPTVRDVVVRVAVDQGVEAVRVPWTRSAGITALAVRRLATSLRRHVERAGLRTTATSAGMDDAGHLRRDRLIATIDTLRHESPPSAELGVHPGEAVDPDRLRYHWGYTWPLELDALCDPDVAAHVESSGFRLGTFGDLPGPVGSD